MSHCQEIYGRRQRIAMRLSIPRDPPSVGTGKPPSLVWRTIYSYVEREYIKPTDTGPGRQRGIASMTSSIGFSGCIVTALFSHPPYVLLPEGIVLQLSFLVGSLRACAGDGWRPSSRSSLNVVGVATTIANVSIAIACFEDYFHARSTVAMDIKIACVNIAAPPRTGRSIASLHDC